jgi:hypothetical protein
LGHAVVSLVIHTARKPSFVRRLLRERILKGSVKASSKAGS